ncbi:hypothetical protein BH11MYX3_BH11MYX3_07990 [soil metagenome]
MSRVVVDLAQDPRFATDLAAGGVFIPACELAINDQCELVVRGASGELALPARVVYIDPAKGAGLELIGFGPAIRDRIAALAVEPETTERIDLMDPDEADEAGEPPGPGDAEDADGSPARAPNLLDRLRGLSLAQQVKTANSPDPGTRMALERMYGKAVWEALLRNPRLTAPEVSKLARMGTLPRTMLENILANSAWLQIPEVRRALLSNPRLGTDQIMRVLRLMPKHELKIAGSGTAYPFAVRDVAKRLLKDD